MKYFTPELYIRGNSPDDAVVEGIEDEWERAIRRYRRHWNKIKRAFPEGVRRFEEARVCLHDAQLLHMGREQDRLLLVLEMEPPARNLVILTFTLLGEPEITTGVLPENLRESRPYWLYEEFNLDRQQTCGFEVFFSNGWALRLRFRDFQFVVAQPLTAAANGAATERDEALARR